jgi:transcriptional regulator with XRE-family HTH domain
LQPLDAERVKEWRHRRMLSQQEVADRAGTSLFTIQRIERGEGNVRPKTGRGVAAALGVQVEELLPKAQSPLPLDYETEERARASGIEVGEAYFVEPEEGEQADIVTLRLYVLRELERDDALVQTVAGLLKDRDKAKAEAG